MLLANVTPNKLRKIYVNMPRLNSRRMTPQTEFSSLYWANSPDERSPQPKRQCEIGAEVEKWTAYDRTKWMRKEGEGRRQYSIKKQKTKTSYLHKLLCT